jgi:SAM-dependent methyltransferase
LWIETSMGALRRHIDAIRIQTAGLKDHGGFRAFAKGKLKNYFFRLLRRFYRFDLWHTTPVDWRPYAIDLARYANDLIRAERLGAVVEVGCGLGGIVARLHAAHRVGIDIDANVIRAARLLNRSVRFFAGSFEAVGEGPVDLLIAVNFLHEIPPETLAPQLAETTARAKVRYLIVDSAPYRYHHDCDKLLGAGWQKVWQSAEYANGRKVHCYRRQG